MRKTAYIVGIVASLVVAPHTGEVADSGTWRCQQVDHSPALWAMAPDAKLTERDWVQRIVADWTKQGSECQTEVATPDGSRCDILTPTTAWEVDWASKKFEAVGQALYYSLALSESGDKRGPGIVLLMKGPEDKDDYLRCARLCDKYGIRLMTVDAR